LARAIGWALHKQSGVHRDATHLRGDEAPKVRPLAVGSVMSLLDHCHANADNDCCDRPPRPCSTFGFHKSWYRARAIHATRICLQIIHYCSLLSLFLKIALNTLSRRSLLAEMCTNPDMHPIIPLAKMVYPRYFNVYNFHPNDASFMYGTVQSRTDVRQGYPLGTLLFNLAISTPLRNIGERCMDSSAIHAFSGDRKYLITTVLVPPMTALTTEELGKYAR
jgi:hypothetical protein